MKKLFKSLLLAGLVAVNASAIDATFTISPDGAAKITNLISGPILLTSLQITHQGNASFPYAIIDGRNTNATLGPTVGYTLVGYSNGPVTTYSSYLTNITKAVTNFSGTGSALVTTQQVYSGLWTTGTVQGATTNFYRRVFSGTLPGTAGSIVAIPISSSAYFTYGLTFTNGALNTNLTINVSYLPAR